MRFPFKYFMEGMGAIGIDRSPKKPGEPRPSMVEAMISLFEENEELVVMVTPGRNALFGDKMENRFLPRSSRRRGAYRLRISRL